jgi:shikimate kinase
MHHEETVGGEALSKWENSRPSDDGTHHVTEEGPLYNRRFEEVLSFHYPGLAPVRLDGKWFHIRSNGDQAYTHKFDLAFGFYEERAAVKQGGKWFHIKPDGSKLYDRSYSWCGNYQQGLCAVRDHEGGYHHIDLDGYDVYEERYLYAGDYREGYAVVRGGAGCLHIDRCGNPLNSRIYLDLGVFHKGYASAKDEYGWFHIDKSGEPLYTQRYSSVEPFYNGLALCLEHGNRLVRIDMSGAVQEVITAKPEKKVDGRKVLIIGNLSSGKTTMGRELAKKLDAEYIRIDDCRRMMSDATMAGEYRAWHRFISVCEKPQSTILEFSGGGPHVYNVAKALENSGLQTFIIWLDLPVKECIASSIKRRFDAPYPYAMGDLTALIKHIAAEIEAAWRNVWSLSPSLTAIRIVDPRNTTVDSVLKLLLEGER